MTRSKYTYSEKWFRAFTATAIQVYRARSDIASSRGIREREGRIPRCDQNGLCLDNALFRGGAIHPIVVVEWIDATRRDAT